MALSKLNQTIITIVTLSLKLEMIQTIISSQQLSHTVLHMTDLDSNISITSFLCEKI